MKILISGGHLTPALALCDYVKAEYPEHTLVFVGRKFSQDNLKQLAHEYEETARRKITFVTFWAPRLQQTGSLFQTALIPLRFLVAIIRALLILIWQRPKVLVSFGGYLAVPLSIAAWLLRIPVVTHEQTRVMGKANLWIAKLARKVAVSFEDTARYFPATKVVVTGNPLRSSLLNKATQKPTWIETSVRKPILYVTGGNQGSQVINTLIEQMLPSLTKSWLVIHQCGNPTISTNYKRTLDRAKKKLPKTHQSSYHVFEWLPETELAWVYQHASCVLSRAGANTLSELIALKVPSLLIPLPFSPQDEQQRNAEWLNQAGGALVIPQKELSAERVLSDLQYIRNHHLDLKASLGHIKSHPNAAQMLYQVISQAVT